MEDQPAANNLSRKPLACFWPWLVVLLVLLFIGFIRLHVLEMPLERDEGEYAYAGQLILQGIPPYELAYNMKLPGTYFAYAAGMAIFGQTIAGVHLTLLVANSLTIIFVFLLGRKLFGVTAGLVACASYGLMSVSPTVFGMAAHANHFVVLFAVPATLLLLLAEERESSSMLFVSGLLYGLAYFMKQQGVCFIFFGGIYLFLRAATAKNIFTRDFAKRILIFAGSALLPLAMFCLACLVAGDFARFLFWTFRYASWYASLLPLSEGKRLLFGRLYHTASLSFGFWALAAIGLVLAIFDKKLRRPALFLLVFWLCSFLGTAMGFYFRENYFILILPAFALMVGMAVAAMQHSLRLPRWPDIFQGLPLILFGLAFVWAVIDQSQNFFQLTPQQTGENIYQPNPFEKALVVGDYLREHSAPEAKIAVIGSEPEIYFYARRHSATGYIYTYALMEPQPAALAMQHDMIAEIETNRPEYLVHVTSGLSWLFQRHSSHLIVDWASEYEYQFYDQVGVVHSVGGQIESVWGEAAKNADINGDCIIVYRRKPDAS